MASGRPDYYIGVDITYQDLAELIVRPQNIPQIDVDILTQTLSEVTNRPKYGGALLVHGSVAVTAGQINTLVGVDGKGMIYGGYVYLDYANSQSAGQVRMLADDQTLNYDSFSLLNNFGVTEPGRSAVFLSKYDDTNFIYCAGLSHGITFETSIELKYFENQGYTPTVHYRLVYALI